MARDFNGSADKVTLATYTAISFLDAFTVQAWVRRGGTYGGGNLGRVLDKQNGGSGHTAEWLWFNDPSDPAPPVNAFAFAVQRWSGGEAYWYYPLPTPTTDWHHHIIAYDYADGTSGLPLCNIDGANQTMTNLTPATGTKNAATGTAASLGIGGRVFNDLRGFDGEICEVAIWNRKLTAGEMKVAYRYGAAAVPQGLVLYMPLFGTASPEPNYRASTHGTVAGTTRTSHPATRPSFGTERLTWTPPVTRQAARPASDVSVGTWTTQSGGTTNLYATLDEAPPADDADFIKSPTDASTTAEVQLGAVTDPATGDVRITFRHGLV